MDIQQQKYSNILLIGDSCEDIFHYGRCERISPEAPVLVLKKEFSSKTSGMAGNVKNNLSAFKNNIYFYTNTEKIIKNRYIETKYNQHLLRVDEGESTKLKPFCLKKIDRNIKYEALIISDYNKGFITEDVAKKLCMEFKDIPIFVDSKKKDLSCFSNCYLKINNIEYKNASKFGDNVEKIITMGSDGAIYKGKVYPTTKVDVFDVSGAGDVFLSALASMYLEYRDIPNAIVFANKCASYSVSKLGTYVVKKEDLERFII